MPGPSAKPGSACVPLAFCLYGIGKDGLSVGVRGPVSIPPAFSVDKADITSTQIANSSNSETKDNKSAEIAPY